MTKSSGASLIETLVCLLIATPILLGLMSSIHHGARIRHDVSREYLRSRNEVYLRNILADVMQDTDGHRLQILPRVHRQGVLRFFDGSLHPVNGSRTLGVIPDKQSDAFTNVKLHTEASLRVIRAEGSAFTACLIFHPSAVPWNAYRSVIALSADGIFELKVLQNLSGSGGCRLLHLMPVKSMSAARAQSEDLSFLSLLIPIVAHYSYYVSRAGDLRYLSHVGEQTIENQPLLTDFPIIEVRASLAATNQLISLQARALRNRDQIPLIRFTALLSRTAHYNYLSHFHDS